VILVSNGFAALFAASRLVPTTEGSVVSIPVSTCFAIPNVARANNRSIRFVDADLNSMGMPAVTPRHGDALIIAPDHFGNPSPIVDATTAPSIPIVHDAAQSFFSIHTGHARVAKATTLSFYPSKLANGIDGGAVLVDDDELAAVVRQFCYYENQVVPESGYRMNLRLPNLHAAFLLGTLEHADEIRERMLATHARLRAAAYMAGLIVPAPGEGTVPIRFVVRAQSESDRDNLVAHMRAAGVEAGRELVWLCDLKVARCFPAASALVRTSLSIPLHPCLSNFDLEHLEHLLAHWRPLRPHS